jgi:hypothetical protein
MGYECCQVEDCKNQGKLHRKGYRYFPRGFCSTHYKIFVKENRDVIDNDKIRCQKCSVEGCGAPPPYKKEMCDKHYTRNKKHGNANFVEKRREGQTEHPLYDTYGGMKKRCLNESDKDYFRYGGRGILICERWLGVDGFFNFAEDMGKKPEGYTLDRKDADGDYAPENCRWANIHTQSGNKRNSVDTGVTFVKKSNRFRVRISVSGKTYGLGSYKTMEEALEARRIGEIRYLGFEVQI